MASYRNIEPRNLLRAGEMTGTDTIYSRALDLLHLSHAAFMAEWTGNAVGSFRVEVSIDGTNYADLGVSISDAAGAAAFRVINVGSLGVRYARLAYTNASGTGSLNVTGMAKGGAA